MSGLGCRSTDRQIYTEHTHFRKDILETNNFFQFFLAVYFGALTNSL